MVHLALNYILLNSHASSLLLANIMKGATNSVLTLPAQINKLLHQGSYLEKNIPSLREKLQINKQYLGRYYYLFILMESSGCRVSEILQIRYNDISDTGQILVHGLKKSQNRVIKDSEATQFCLKQRSKGLDPFFGMNRFTAYRLLKNIGIGKTKKGRVHQSITHIFRDNYIANLRTLAIDKKDLSNSIGHKSQNSTEYYGKD